MRKKEGKGKRILYICVEERGRAARVRPRFESRRGGKEEKNAGTRGDKGIARACKKPWVKEHSLTFGSGSRGGLKRAVPNSSFERNSSGMSPGKELMTKPLKGVLQDGDPK